MVTPETLKLIGSDWRKSLESHQWKKLETYFDAQLMTLWDQESSWPIKLGLPDEDEEHSEPILRWVAFVYQNAGWRTSVSGGRVIFQRG